MCYVCVFMDAFECLHGSWVNLFGKKGAEKFKMYMLLGVAHSVQIYKHTDVC